MPYSLKYMLIVYLRWLFVAKKLMWINLAVYSRKCSPLNSSGVDPTPPVVDPRVRYHPHVVGRSQILHCLESQQSLLRPAPQKVVTQALQSVWFKCTSEMTFGVDTMWRDALKWRLKRRCVRDVLKRRFKTMMWRDALKWRLKRRCLHDVLTRCFKTMVRTGRLTNNVFYVTFFRIGIAIRY